MRVAAAIESRSTLLQRAAELVLMAASSDITAAFEARAARLYGGAARA